jgi:sulfopyruvate decarboxylase TPP-binding subunit
MVGKVTPDNQASASLLPSILGIGKYGSPNDALIGCIRALQGRPREELISEPADWGNRFEPAILKEASMRLGLDNLDISHDQAFQHSDLPLACSLDGTAYGRGLLITPDPAKGIFVMGQDEIILEGVGVMEAKLTGADFEDVPPLWRGPVQLQAQMDILGAKWGAVCTLYRGVKLHIYLFAPHAGTVQEIRRAVLDFDRRLDRFKRTGEIEHYEPQDSADAQRTWPNADENKLDDPLGLGTAENYLCEEIKILQEQAKELEKKIDEKVATLKSKMKEYPRAVTRDFEVRWPMRHYKAQPERLVPAKEAHSVRQSTLTIKERKA